MRPTRVTVRFWVWFVSSLATALVPISAGAQLLPGKVDPDGLTMESIRVALPEYFSHQGGAGSTSPEAIPDVFGPGAVLTVGNIFMKITNWGHVGNLFMNVSSDPSAQWKGASGIEYLSSIRLAVGAVNTIATDPVKKRRVSYLLEWRPKTLDPEDRIYRGYDGIINGTRFWNDDGDKYIDPQDGLEYARVDEDFLDGRDNDGQGGIDEDFAALGQQMYTCAIWDNTIQAINSTFNEKHVPLDIEARQTAWAYSIQGYQNFNIVEYEIFNRSGHDLDSVAVGFLIDMDSGPFDKSDYFQDDFDLPHFPVGEFPVDVGSTLPDRFRRQEPRDPLLDGQTGVGPALCPTIPIRINGFSIADDNADDGRTLGIPSFLLVDHSVDPLGVNGPKKVGFRAFRSFISGDPFNQGGSPTIDQQRFEFLTSAPPHPHNIDLDEDSPLKGFIDREFLAGDTKGDYVQWVSVGSPLEVNKPGMSYGLWRLADGQSIKVTIAFAIAEGSYASGSNYLTDYDRFVAGSPDMDFARLQSKYPVLANAVALQIVFEGVHVSPPPPGFLRNDYHGRETPIRLSVGEPDRQVTESCAGREPEQRVVTVNSREWSWFDFDCDYCTGPWKWSEGLTSPTGGALFHKTWNSEAPPPNPTLNTVAGYNFTDNPGRSYLPTGDREVLLAWDNLSEVTRDPKTECFDFRGYRVWKVSDWTRPVGSAGPSESDWKLVGDFRLFDYEIRRVTVERNYTIDSVTSVKTCPQVFVPNHVWDTLGVTRTGKVIPICLDRGDLWDRQSGAILKPDTSVRCVPGSGTDGCDGAKGGIIHRGAPSCTTGTEQVFKKRYPIGRYRYVDREVKNGFIYFYSVTAMDSVTDQSVTVELEGRRSAVEAEGIYPQVSTANRKSVWVVPNPYRGYNQIPRRSSSWDLTPNASDPTGTHIDFFGLPTGSWTIRIYTVSGDLVAELRSSDPVNESVRGPQTIGTPPVVVPGYNRQQDHAGDGQARWNLISRNGQDVVSGIYLFTVESGLGAQRGRFVIIR